MKSFIEVFYYGNIDPQNSGFEDKESVQRKMQTIRENEDFIADTLSGKDMKGIRVPMTAGIGFRMDIMLKHLSALNYKTDLRQGAAVEYVSCDSTGNACKIVDDEGEDHEYVEDEQ
ncbi:MAG: hypothetical protein IJG50_00015 [Clostridia bacterium]|nr:hypothetical protein [Clostridia bacterium]